MKKFNLFNEIIIVEKSQFDEAINSGKTFAITIDAKIIYDNFNQPMIYKGVGKPEKNYQVVEDEQRILIKAFSNWQELIKLNTPIASYDDTTADGVGEFSDKNLEDIGWHAAEFNINYRTLVEVLEDRCEGVVLCIEQEDPYQFSGLGFIKDNSHAKEVLFDYCKNIAKELIENDKDFAKENLTDDEEEAAEFFGVL
jgi:hypothetical protein